MTSLDGQPPQLATAAASAAIPGVGPILAGLQVFGALKGLLGGNAAQKRAEEERQRAIADFLAQSSSNQYNRTLGARTSLYSLQGNLNDALGSNARSLGDANAASGVYNSSAVAGSNTLNAASNAAAAARYGTDLQASLNDQAGSDARYATGLKMGVANQDLMNARADTAGAGAGLNSVLGGWVQDQLARTGVPTQSRSAFVGPGMQNSTLPGLPQTSISPSRSRPYPRG